MKKHSTNKSKAKSVKKRKFFDNKSDIPNVLFLISFLLPVLAWLLGTIANPSGWMSVMPLYAYLLLPNFAQELWPIMLLVVLMLVGISVTKRIRRRLLVAVTILFASLFYSIQVFGVVESAQEDEFTG
jgi:polyferredoxin